MPSWRNANRQPSRFSFPRRRLCSGRLLRRAALVSLIATSSALAQQKPTAKPAAAHSVNELTIAGMRPGRVTLKQATHQLRDASPLHLPEQPKQPVWEDSCGGVLLTIDLDERDVIQVIRLEQCHPDDCVALTMKPWKTGRGLQLRDDTNKLLALYGPPDSKSPSTRNDQPLELWYYAFDWAGPDVPQVMEVLCTREKEGQPGRVVEITLAAPSL
jgi:hypothetical protein